MQRNARGWTSALDDLDRALSGRPARRGEDPEPPARAPRARRAGSGGAERGAAIERRRDR